MSLPTLCISCNAPLTPPGGENPPAACNPNQCCACAYLVTTEPSPEVRPEGRWTPSHGQPNHPNDPNFPGSMNYGG